MYRQARDLAHREIEEVRQNYYYTRLSRLTDPKDIWRELEHLRILSRKKSTALPFSVNEINAHFRSVSYDQDTPPVTDFFDSLASSNHLEQFTFEEIQVSDVIAAVNLFTTQARGPDGIPQHVIRLALPFLAPFICRIFNQSLREAHFPSLWKKSIVIALNKVSSPSCLNDFHPISRLCSYARAGSVRLKTRAEVTAWLGELRGFDDVEPRREWWLEQNASLSVRKILGRTYLCRKMYPRANYVERVLRSTREWPTPILEYLQSSRLLYLHAWQRRLVQKRFLF